MDRLCVTADDFGLCPEINEAVLRLHDAGVVNRTSVIANGGFFEESVRQLSSRPGLEAGIHLNLTDGRPVAAARSLVNAEGNFIGGRHYGVAWGVLTGAFKIGDIASEWRAQIRKLRDSGIRVRHLNAHGHLHLLPALHGIVADLLGEFQIPYVRLVLSARSARTFVFDRLSRGLLRTLRDRGIQADYPTQILGITSQGRLNKTLILSELRRPATGTVELIVHPASAGNAYHKAWGYRTGGELESLLDPEVVQMIRSRVSQRG